MSRINRIRILAVASTIILVIAKVVFYFSWWYCLFPFIVYLAIIIYGSINVQSGLFLDVICKANTSSKEIAITFDDGPLLRQTESILNTLKLNDVHAAFFCIGKKMEENPEILKRIHEDGHIIGNHTYSHDYLFDLFSVKKMTDELIKTNALVNRIIGLEPRFFRPPYGVTNPDLAAAVETSGHYSIGWSIRSMDTVLKKEQKLLNKTANLKSGDILLFHDSATITVVTLQKLLNEIKKKGFSIVRLDKLLNLEPYA